MKEALDKQKHAVEEVRESSADSVVELEREKTKRKRYEDDCNALRQKIDRLHVAQANGSGSQEVRC